MDEKKTVKNTVSDKKTIGSSHLIRRKPRPSSFHKQINRKTFCERKKFYYLRSGETSPDGMELLSVDTGELEARSTIVSEAREKLRVQIQNRGGNACADFNMRKGAGVKLANVYCTGDIVASGRAALVAPCSLSAEEKQARRETFSPAEKEETMLPLIGKILPFLLLLVALFFLAKRAFQ